MAKVGEYDNESNEESSLRKLGRRDT